MSFDRCTPAFMECLIREHLKIYQNPLRDKCALSVLQLSCTKDQLRQIESRLSQAIALYKRRLEWLTTESRRMFGVIEERCVVVVLDVDNLSPHQFDQYRAAVERLLREQLAQVSKFNILRLVD